MSQVVLHEKRKVEQVKELMDREFDLERFLKSMK